MKRLLILLIILIVAAGCNNNDPITSTFFNNCYCEKIELSNVQLEDSLGNYEINLPVGKWIYGKNLDSLGNGITMMDDESKHLKMVSVTELIKVEPWPSKEKSIQEINKRFNVIEQGEYEMNGNSNLWYLVREVEPENFYALYITIEHPSEDRFVTLTAWRETNGNFREHLCELESVLHSFNYR